MKLLDDLAVSETPPEARRRRFLTGALFSSLGGAWLGSVVVSLRYLWPSVLFERPTRFRAARLGDLLRRPILFLRERGLYLVRDRRGIFAQSAVCTHLGCLTRPNPKEDGFFCPCHGSRFGLDGQVLDGPAPAPLEHLAVERRDDELWVDTGRKEERDVRLDV